MPHGTALASAQKSWARTGSGHGGASTSKISDISIQMIRQNGRFTPAASDRLQNGERLRRQSEVRAGGEGLWGTSAVDYSVEGVPTGRGRQDHRSTDPSPDKAPLTSECRHRRALSSLTNRRVEASGVRSRIAIVRGNGLAVVTGDSLKPFFRADFKYELNALFIALDAFDVFFAIAVLPLGVCQWAAVTSRMTRACRSSPARYRIDARVDEISCDARPDHHTLGHSRPSRGAVEDSRFTFSIGGTRALAT
jgi:hypothetical protein